MDELYVIARGVLLDALDALGGHRDAVVLVGAQAIYLRVGEADLDVAPYTTDGDLAIDPSILSDVPPLEQALTKGGFRPKTRDSVGIWVTQRPTTTNVSAEVAIDLLVPASVSPGKGRRAARLEGHDSRVARIVSGLDGALVDVDTLSLAALDADPRRFDVRVAGSAALLVAKVHKIHERKETDRQSDKDALDVLRLLRGTSTEELEQRYRALLADNRSRAPAEHAVLLIREQSGTRGSLGIAMAVRSAGALADANEIAASCEALANDLLTILSR